MNEPRSHIFSGITKYAATPVQIATQLEQEVRASGGQALLDANSVVIESPNDNEGSIAFTVEVMLVPAGDRTQIVVSRARPAGGEGGIVVLGAVFVIVASIMGVVVVSGNVRGIAGLFAIIGLGTVVGVLAFRYWRGQAEDFATRLVRHTIAIPGESL
jgi:hypothetical protein